MILSLVTIHNHRRQILFMPFSLSLSSTGISNSRSSGWLMFVILYGWYHFHRTIPSISSIANNIRVCTLPDKDSRCAIMCISMVVRCVVWNVPFVLGCWLSYYGTEVWQIGITRGMVSIMLLLKTLFRAAWTNDLCSWWIWVLLLDDRVIGGI